MNITYEISGVDATAARFSSLPDRIRAEVTGEMEFQIADLVQYIVGDKLNGQVLQRRSGKLADAVSGDVQDDGTVITGRAYVGGDVPYAGILEHGGQTSPHQILPDAATALHFIWHGEEMFRSKVNHPGSKIPEFAYMRSGLQDMTAQILQGLAEAVKRGAE
jgi:phage gpG-like protein